jgi:hypothetical protein
LAVDAHDWAIADFTKLIGREPAEKAYWNGRGVARYAKGERQAALADYDEAL